MRTIAFVLLSYLCLLTTATANNGVSYKFSDAVYNVDATEMSISIEIKTTEAMTLADQYYRFYFDSETMSLKEANNAELLSTNQYYNVQVIEAVEGYNASQVGTLSYDDNLGFVNLYIELADLLNGGVSIRPADGWLAVATLTFDVKDNTQSNKATWARENVTADYASAFTMVSEWVQPNEVVTLENVNFTDLDALYSFTRSTEAISITVGPNPTADFIKITANTAFDANSIVYVIDMNGRVLMTQDVSYETEVRVSLAHLNAGTYIVEMIDAEQNNITTEKIVLAK